MLPYFRLQVWLLLTFSALCYSVTSSFLVRPLISHLHYEAQKTATKAAHQLWEENTNSINPSGEVSTAYPDRVTKAAEQKTYVM